MELNKSVNFKTDETLHAEVVEILSQLGLNISAAINMYFVQIAATKSIPFQIKLGDNNDEPR